MTELDKKPPVFAYLVYFFAASFLFYEMALQVSPSIMTKDLMKDLKVDAVGLGIMASVYFYSYTLMQIPAGLLFDRYNCRSLIVSSLLICVLGAFFFGYADSVFLVGTGRFLMGVGSAFAFIGVLVVASQWFPANYFAFLVGVTQLLAAVGAMGGEAPLALLVSHIGWRASIQWMAYGGLILSLLIFFIVRDKPKQFLSAVGTKTTQNRMSISLSRIIGNTQTWWVGLYAFCSWAPITAFAALWGVPYIETLYGNQVNNTLSAIAIAMIWMGLGFASPFIGWLSDKLRLRCILLSICAAIGFFSSVFILYIPHLPFTILLVLLFSFGIASAGQILSFAVVKDNNKPSDTATAIGFNNMAVVAGGALFQPLVGLLLRSFWNGKIFNGSPIYTTQDYRFALSVVPICFFLGWVVSTLFIRETYCKTKYSD